MKIVSKNAKDKKMSDLEKVKEYKEKYTNVYFIENTDISNVSIQSLREAIDGKVLFIKKAIFQKIYPECTHSENYFLVFGTEDIKESLENFEFASFPKIGEVVEESVLIKAGLIRNEDLIPYLNNLIIEGNNYTLTQDFQVCNGGDALNEKQASILKILGYRIGKSKLNIIDIKQTTEMK